MHLFSADATIKSLTLFRMNLAKQFLERWYENGHSLQL